eukprot:TRINITY_DN9488_c0_g1_i3.p1 TRINITY_DN9488_c0_g1~~TRINITY_DN9488_c0_g1_i3.p1  ORF type:complete len:141 (+),score=19.59 TRINITY_DN9488_c0_g1_i3:273-695(+)
METEDMISHLNDALSPFVARVRGESELFEPIEALAFKPHGKTQRRSRRKYLADLISIQRTLGNYMNGLPERPGLIREAKAFAHFISDLTNLLSCRRLSVQDVRLIQMDQNNHFWLSDVQLSSIQDEARYLQREIFEAKFG